jgi:ring-1,2-phenylacetyl-CoA epoxidase subunit PaaE
MFNLFGKNKKKKEEKSSSKNKYLTLKVKEVVQETQDAITIYFEQPENPISYKAGQFFTLMPTIDGKQVRRAYSVCTCPQTDPNPAVTVKRVEGGLVSNWLADNLKAGDELEVMEPIGNFTTELDSSRKRHMVLFGGGSGITPLMALAKVVLHEEPQSVVSLVYANRDTESIIFKEQLDQLISKYNDRFRVIHVLETAEDGWGGPTGWLNTDLIGNLLKELPQLKEESTDYFVCGPEGMMDVVVESLDNLGVNHKRVHKESFTSSVTKEEIEEKQKGATAHEVTIFFEDEEYKITVQPGKSILETALENDIDLPYSCQSGLCTACRGKCTSGSVQMDESEGLSEEELEQGYVLTCVGHPASDNVRIEIE